MKHEKSLFLKWISCRSLWIVRRSFISVKQSWETLSMMKGIRVARLRLLKCPRLMLGAANTRTSQEVKQLIEKCWVQALVCSPALKALRIFSDPQCVTKMFTWHKQTAKYFSSKKMGLFGISRELQFTLCNHNSHMQVLPEWGKKHASKEEKNKTGLEKLW